MVEHRDDRGGAVVPCPSIQTTEGIAGNLPRMPPGDNLSLDGLRDVIPGNAGFLKYDSFAI